MTKSVFPFGLESVTPTAVVGVYRLVFRRVLIPYLYDARP
jgi:hypothetical protein